ncbi:MAG TPA: DHA2 family efflux MFS transporter permease subunit, partial [Candidatus Saccharimonadia bacterium]|nr:DHA2 family efflux MFS transporter permease subunit [Candidatus Saccharimonadia bacterium]
MPAHPHTAVPPAQRKPLGADSPFYHWWITAALMLGFMTAGLSVTVVQLAFPHIMLSLRADLDDMQWVQTSSMIMQAVMMPSVGWLGSRLGNRRLYLLSLGTFVGGSILCGMAWDVSSLIVFRVVQAIGAGPLFPLTQSIMFQTFPEEKRGLAMGVNSLGFSFGPMIGPVIGGYLLEHANWRTVFYINVPVGILGLILAYLVLPYPRRREPRSLDVLGLFSMATFLVTFLLAITQGRNEGWNSQYIVTLFAVAVLAGVGFVVTELRHAEPFVELRLYKNFAFAMASLVVLLNTLTFMASSFVMTLFLQIHLLYTPLQAAWALMPAAVVIGILSVVTGRLSDLISPKVLIIFGLATSALCMFQHATITTVTSLEAITFWFTVRGFTRAFTITPLTTGSLAPLRESQIRMGSGLLSLNRGIASAVSIALTTTVLQNRLAERVLFLVQDENAIPLGAEELLQNFFFTFKQLG